MSKESFDGYRLIASNTIDKKCFIGKYDAEGKLQKVFNGPKPRHKDLKMEKHPLWGHLWDHLKYVLNPHKYEISVIENGKSVGFVKGQNKSFRPISITKSNIGSMGVVFPVLHILEFQNTMYVCIRGLGIGAKHQLDIFVDSQLKGSLEVVGIPRAVDAQGRLYFKEEEDYPQVVRYKLAR